MEIWCTRGYKVGDGHCWPGVEGVYTDTENDLVVAVEVEALGENTTDFSVVRFLL